MGRAPKPEVDDQVRNDPGESNDPKSSRGDFETHIWTSINLVYERLGEIGTKIDQLSKDQDKLKTSVEKHDKIVMRVIYTVGGIVAVIVVLWFIYQNFLKGHLTFNTNGM